MIVASRVNKIFLYKTCYKSLSTVTTGNYDYRLVYIICTHYLLILFI